MTNDLTTTEPSVVHKLDTEGLQDFVTFFVDEQYFGIPVLKVQDILTPEVIASIPLAPPDVRGSINLRGRIVTVIDVRVRLGLARREDYRGMMGVTVEHKADLYSLLVDSVGDVIGLSEDEFESNPSTLDPLWREFAQGIYRLDKKLMVVLDVERLLAISSDGNRVDPG